MRDVARATPNEVPVRQSGPVYCSALQGDDHCTDGVVLAGAECLNLARAGQFFSGVATRARPP
jgi:hypothetical protein